MKNVLQIIGFHFLYPGSDVVNNLYLPNTIDKMMIQSLEPEHLVLLLKNKQSNAKFATFINFLLN